MTRALLRASVAVALAAALSCSGGSGPAAPGVHKVQVSAGGAAGLLRGGGRVLEDYGAFQLVEVGGAALASVAPDPSIQLRDEYNVVHLNAGAVDTATARGASLRGLTPPASGKRFHLVQFSGPIQPEWYSALEATGVQVVTYVPHNAYLVYGGAGPLARLQGLISSLRSIQWDGAYLDEYKLDPSARAMERGAYSIQLLEDPDANRATLDLVDRLQEDGVRIQAALGYVNVVARLGSGAIHQVALRPDVVSIQPYPEPVPLCERVGVILSGNLSGTAPGGPGYLAWLASKGFTQAQFTASGFGVDLSDSGIDNATQAPNHFGLYVGGDVLAPSRILYNRLEGTPNPGSSERGCDGHGTLNAHIIGGFSNQSGAPFTDAQGYAHGLGVAPFVKIGSSVIFDPAAFTSPVYENLQSKAYQDGARISSNGWGTSSNLYSADSQRYDALVRDAQPAGSTFAAPGNQEMVIVFAAGNRGPGAGTVGAPGTGKNVLTVGASENVRPYGEVDQCNVGDASSDSALDVAASSSRGPAADGRRKPDLMAPGTHVGGGTIQAAGQRANPPGNPLGQVDNCFNGTRICGGDVTPFYPDGQQWYSASSGTSHAAPVAAGAAALLRQHFINQGMAPPSPAMTKAFLVGSARYMTGTGANDDLYSTSQGMGLLDLGMAFDGTGRLVADEDTFNNLFTASGQTRVFNGTVGDPSKPFRVTLAWTDAPGSTTGAAYLNNLDLTVTVGGGTYLGNVFTGASSATGGTADLVNNVESVFLPAGVTGPFTVTVTAANINSDGVPGAGTATDQDFALLVYNRCTDAPAAPTGLAASVNGDNRIDLTWSAVAGATDYVIYRSLTSGGPYTQVGTATAAAAAYADIGVSGGTTYSYVVRGRICAESASSSEVSAIATGPCTRPPLFAGLSSAANGASSACTAMLSWPAATPVCGGAITYSVYRSQAAGFVPGPANRIAAGLAGTTFADDLGLTDRTAYHYVVRATEVSSATNQDANLVERSAAPTGPITTDVDYFDDFDGTRSANAPAYWIPTTLSGTNGALNITSGCHYQSATSAYRFGAVSSACGGTYPVSTNALLKLGGDGTVAGINGFSIPAAPLDALMTFNLWYSIEGRFDGAYLAYSTTGAGGTYAAVPDAVTPGKPSITGGGYDGALNAGGRGWTGVQAGADGALKEVSVDLSALAGQTVWFGFRFTTDNSIVREGLYLDDVRVRARSAAGCVTRSPAVRYQITGLPAAVEAGVPATFHIAAVDALGQTDVGYRGTASFSGSDGQAVLPPRTSFTGGVASGVSITFATPGSQSVTASDVEDASISGSAGTVVMDVSPVAYVLSGLPAGAAAGSEVTFTVTARDGQGNIATGYSGTATVASSDPAAILPGNPTFAGGVASGVRTTFLTPGPQTVTVTDALRPALSATATIDVDAFPPPAVAVTSPADGDVVNGHADITAAGSVAPGTTLTRLAVLVDGEVIGAGATSPVTVTWGNARIPNHSRHAITAVITDSAGNAVTSSAVNVTFQAAGCGCGTTAGSGGGLAWLVAAGQLVRWRRRRRSAWLNGPRAPSTRLPAPGTATPARSTAPPARSPATAAPEAPPPPRW